MQNQKEREGITILKWNCLSRSSMLNAIELEMRKLYQHMINMCLTSSAISVG